jgi:hypothetical protein
MTNDERAAEKELLRIKHLIGDDTKSNFTPKKKKRKKKGKKTHRRK